MKLSDRVLAETIMKVWAAADHTFDRDMWLEQFDVDAAPAATESLLLADGAIVNCVFGGRIWLTDNRHEAQRFATASDALEAWNTVSKTRPVRPDGRPNKPLSALSIQLEPVVLS
jgi:hypothetical protein